TRPALIWYVATNSPVDGPGTPWSNAFHTIQGAADVATDGDLVLVTNGIYDTGSRAVVSPMTNRVVINRAITVRSVNGPDVTIIKGAKAAGGGNGNGAIRCVYLASGAVLDGFTLTNGATCSSGDGNYTHGGGVWCESDNAIISNCFITGNSAAQAGGGARKGTLFRCVLKGNVAVTSHGGGSYYGKLRNCLLTGNSAGDYGGGTAWAEAYNCTFVSNSAPYGGGAAYGSVWNCILYYNTSYNWHGSAVFFYCCTTPELSAANGNITNAPQFLDLANANYRLSPGSPCIDRGANTNLSADLDGIARPLDGNNDGTNTVDMGGYEFIHSLADSDADGLTDSNEIYSVGTDPLRSDTDGDGAGDGDEVFADTIPTNSGSYFHLTGLRRTNSFAVTFVCTNSRVYSLQAATNMVDGSWLMVDGATNVAGDIGGTMSLTDTVDSVQRSYRVGVGIP
ncbi:MAG: hypothetical protein KJ726_02425, partial [Verrucomicrobia bacterium]|nr:hypothetical protein [Verrucomicrobiota bacterium]